MRFTLLGSGGTTPVPKPTCMCNLCEEAREKGIPYFRTGASLFFNDENVLFDTPEEVRMQLNRNNINDVDAIFYTHWHPDHTAGMRVIEQLNLNWLSENYPIDSVVKELPIYLSKQTWDALAEKLSLLTYYDSINLIKPTMIKNGDSIKFGNFEIKVLSHKNSLGEYFIIQSGSKKLVYAPCELFKFKNNEHIHGSDVLVLHLGWFGKSGERDALSENHWKQKEDNFEELLNLIKEVKPKRVIFTHIEHQYGKSFDDFLKLAKEYDVEFGYDGMEIII